MSASADVLALANAEFDIGDIPVRSESACTFRFTYIYSTFYFMHQWQLELSQLNSMTAIMKTFIFFLRLEDYGCLRSEGIWASE